MDPTEARCVEEAPQPLAQLPDVGDLDTVEFWFGGTGWTFDATFTRSAVDCPRSGRRRRWPPGSLVPTRSRPGSRATTGSTSRATARTRDSRASRPSELRLAHHGGRPGGQPSSYVATASLMRAALGFEPASATAQLTITDADGEKTTRQLPSMDKPRLRREDYRAACTSRATSSTRAPLSSDPARTATESDSRSTARRTSARRRPRKGRTSILAEPAPGQAQTTWSGRHRSLPTQGEPHNQQERHATMKNQPYLSAPCRLAAATVLLLGGCSSDPRPTTRRRRPRASHRQRHRRVLRCRPGTRPKSRPGSRP